MIPPEISHSFAWALIIAGGVAAPLATVLWGPLTRLGRRVERTKALERIAVFIRSTNPPYRRVEPRFHRWLDPPESVKRAMLLAWAVAATCWGVFGQLSR